MTQGTLPGMPKRTLYSKMLHYLLRDSNPMPVYTHLVAMFVCACFGLAVGVALRTSKQDVIEYVVGAYTPQPTTNKPAPLPLFGIEKAGQNLGTEAAIIFASTVDKLVGKADGSKVVVTIQLEKKDEQGK